MGNDIYNGWIMILNHSNVCAEFTTAAKINRNGTTYHIVTIKNAITSL